jgi:hypothetical protein
MTPRTAAGLVVGGVVVAGLVVTGADEAAADVGTAVVAVDVLAIVPKVTGAAVDAGLVLVVDVVGDTNVHAIQPDRMACPAVSLSSAQKVDRRPFAHVSSGAIANPSLLMLGMPVGRS